MTTLGIVMPMVADGVPPTQFMAELVEEAQTAERAGLDCCLVPEHHEAPSNALPDPLTVVGWLLASTSRLRVGTGVLLLPLYHPVHIAEQAGILQAVSGGRLILGLGAGYQPPDFAIFGADRRTRYAALERGIETLRACWRGDPVGGYRVAPTPATPPEIVLGGYGPRALERAARLGDVWLASPTHTVTELEAMAATYRDAAAALDVTPRTIVLRELWVDETDARARATYGPHIERVFRYYHRAGALDHWPDVAVDDLTLDRALSDVVICGSAETVSERVAELTERTDAAGCLFMLRMPGGPSHERVCEAIARLGSEVAPRLRSDQSEVATHG